MEAKEDIVLAVGKLTPSVETERQAYRAARRVFPLILLCIGCGTILFSQLFRIGLSVARILIFKQPVYSAVSLWIAVACILFAVFLLLWGLFAPRRSARRRIRKLKETFASVPTLTCDFCEDRIALRADEAETGIRYPYTAIRRCTETRDLFVLVTKEKQFLSVEKHRLALIDDAGFRTLIREKCPKAKVNWREAK